MNKLQRSPEPLCQMPPRRSCLEDKQQFDVEGAMLLNDTHRRKHEHSRP
jgi:hypothetical protein